LEGLEISEVSLSDLEFTSRLDPEYYRKEFIVSESTLKTKKHERLEVLANFLIGPFGSSFDTENYEVSETASYRYIRGRDVKPYFLMNDDSRFLPEQDFKRLEKYSLKENDILISVVGTLGNACIILKNDVPAIFSNKSTVLRNITVNPYYILTYLNCKYGKNLLLRKTRGAIQTGLNLDDLKSLDVPTFSKPFQQQIEDLVKSAHSTQETSKTLYQEAENLLLSELGIDESIFKVSKNEVVTNTKTFADFENSWRLDAEYYQPKYDIYFENLSKCAFEKEWNIVNLSSLTQPLKYGSSSALEYTQNGVPFLRIADLTDYQFNPKNLKYISIEDAEGELDTCKVKENDVLISRSGTLGLTVVIPKSLENAIFGSYFIRVRLDLGRINPHYLALFMNTRAGKPQVEQANTGGVQTNLTIPVIESFKIPLPPLNIQDKFIEKVFESKTLKSKSEQLLGSAKRAVELAIEEGEDAAMRWIKEIL
jgi:restriction endonuclease S subunit